MNTPAIFGRTTAAALLVMAAAAAQATTPTHLYTLNGTLADSFGGASLVANGGTLGATGYSFGANQGLSLSNALPSSTYTIDTTFEFDATSGYRKIIDFNNLVNDQGLYVFSSALNYYPVMQGPSAPITDGTVVRVTLSRDGATQLVTGYVNGVQQFSFTDSGNLATFSSAGQIGQFFVDDVATGQREASSGFVDYIAVYNTALAAGEIATLTPTTAVPEPAESALLLAGLGLLGCIARRGAAAPLAFRRWRASSG